MFASYGTSFLAPHGTVRGTSSETAYKRLGLDLRPGKFIFALDLAANE